MYAMTLLQICRHVMKFMQSWCTCQRHVRMTCASDNNIHAMICIHVRVCMRAICVCAPSEIVSTAMHAGKDIHEPQKGLTCRDQSGIHNPH